MQVTIHQPEFLPWLGFFDRLNQSDIFVILDDVSYEKNGFINRNKIKDKDAWKWITIPVIGRSSNKKIREVLIDNGKEWQKSLLEKIKLGYKGAPCFEKYYGFLEDASNRKWEKISDLDSYLIENIVDFLGIKVEIKKSSELNIDSQRTDRLVDICKRFKADTYLSGPAGKDYMDLEKFEKENIKVIFQDFLHPEYEQQSPENGFLPGMSIMDLLFNKGSESLNIIEKNNKKL